MPSTVLPARPACSAMPPQPHPISSIVAPSSSASASSSARAYLARCAVFQADVLCRQTGRWNRSCRWVEPKGIEIIAHVIVGFDVAATAGKCVSAPFMGQLVAEPHLEQTLPPAA